MVYRRVVEIRFHEDGIHSAVEMCKKLLAKDDVVLWMPRFDVKPKQSLLGSAFMSMFRTVARKWMPPNAKLTFTPSITGGLFHLWEEGQEETSPKRSSFDRV